MTTEEKKEHFKQCITRLNGAVDPDDLFVSLFLSPLRKKSTGVSWPDGGGAGTERGDIADALLWLKLTSFRHEFARGNQAAAFDIYAFCHKHDLTLPDDVSQWINEHPDKLVSSRKPRDKNLRNRNWRFELLTLVALFNVTPDKAAGVISNRLAAAGIHYEGDTVLQYQSRSDYKQQWIAENSDISTDGLTTEEITFWREQWLPRYTPEDQDFLRSHI